MAADCRSPMGTRVLGPDDAMGAAVEATIDLRAIAHNVGVVRERSGADVMAVVKADGSRWTSGRRPWTCSPAPQRTGRSLSER
jgi:hypothetical protein